MPSAREWLVEIEQATKFERDWREEAKRLVERYRDDGSFNSRFNILFSNVMLLLPTVYAQRPVADVRRRVDAGDPFLSQVSRRSAQVLERALAYCMDDPRYSFDGDMTKVALDYLITGRGVARVVYDAEISRLEPEFVDGQYYVGGQPVLPEFDGDDAYVEQVEDESVFVRHVHWDDFRLSPARSWDDVSWVAFRHCMTREELVDEFGDVGRTLPLNLRKEETEGLDEDVKPRGEVWELWDKRSRMRVWVSQGHSEVIREDEDPLGLEGFFPCPEPIYAVQCTDSLVPVPEFRLYKAQADELEMVQERIASLVEMCRAVTLVDADMSEVLAISKAVDGTTIPIDRHHDVAQDLNSSIWSWPLERYIQAIQVLTQRFNQVLGQIHQLIGLGDALRGSPEPRVTKVAEQLAAASFSARQTPRSAPMARFVRDVLRIKGEVMAEMFEPQTLSAISGVVVTPPMQELLSRDKLRNYAVEVATDGTVRPDRIQERQEALDYIGSVTQYLQVAVPLAQQVPELTPMLTGMLKAASRTFPFAREIEGMLEDAAQQQQQLPQQQSNL